MIKEGEAWLDFRLTEEAMDHLWDSIKQSDFKKESANKTLAGNISKSIFLQDKDNWFFENVLKYYSEYLYYKDWNNYYEYQLIKEVPPPVFEVKTSDFWVNYQKQHEFNPPHTHSGLFSFVVFMKIPTHWKDQHALPISSNSNTPLASDFQFLVWRQNGIKTTNISLSPEDEGRVLFFPSGLKHQVFPFYETEEERITISGNITIKGVTENSLYESEKELEELEKRVKSFRKKVNQEKKRTKMSDTTLNNRSITPKLQ